MRNIVYTPYALIVNVIKIVLMILMFVSVPVISVLGIVYLNVASVVAPRKSVRIKVNMKVNKLLPLVK